MIGNEEIINIKLHEFEALEKGLGMEESLSDFREDSFDLLQRETQVWLFYFSFPSFFTS